MSQLLIGWSSGLVIGLALVSHPFSRAVVIGLIAGIVISGIAIDGPEGYLTWITYFLAEMAKFTAFWVAAITGLVGGAVVAWVARAPRAR
jgi:hypothetical protein